MTSAWLLYWIHLWPRGASRGAVAWRRTFTARRGVWLIESNGGDQLFVVAVSSGYVAATRHQLVRFELTYFWSQRWTWISEVLWSLLPEYMRGHFPPHAKVSLSPAVLSVRCDLSYISRFVSCLISLDQSIPILRLVASRPHQPWVLVILYRGLPFQSLLSQALSLHWVPGAW